MSVGIPDWLIRYRYVVFLGLFLFLAAGVFLFRGNSVSEKSNVTVRKVDIVRFDEQHEVSPEFSGYGTVRSLDQVQLKSLQSGQVVSVPFQKGERVSTGDLLVELDHRVLDAQIAQAYASLDGAQSVLAKLRSGARDEERSILYLQLQSAEQRLSEMKQGSRPEEIALKETRLASVRSALEEAEASLTLAQQKADQDVAGLIDSSLSNLFLAVSTSEIIMTQRIKDVLFSTFYQDDQYPTCRLAIYLPSADGLAQLEDNCKKAFRDFQLMRKSAAALPSDLSVDELLVALEQSRDTLFTIRVLLTSIFTSVKGSFPQIAVAQGELESAASTVARAVQSLRAQLLLNQSILDAAASRKREASAAVESLEEELVLARAGATSQQIAIQESTVGQLRLQLSLARQGARAEDLHAQEAMVRQVEAQLNGLLGQRDFAFIRAPFSGLLLSTPPTIGETVSMGQVIAEVSDDRQLEVQLFVSDFDRSFLQVGLQANITSSLGLSIGLVSSFAPSIDPVIKKIEVLVAVTEHSEFLSIGETVFAEFFPVELSGLFVPLTALRFEQLKAFVLRVNEHGIVEMADVVLGAPLGDRIQILEGIPSTDFVLQDSRGVEGGDVVEIRNL